MTGWYYYFENDGQKRGPYSHSQLTQIAMQGTITRETFVEDSNGRVCAAEEVDYLTFPETVRPLESYSLTDPLLDVGQVMPQSIAVPLPEKNTAFIWTMAIGALLLLIVGGIGLWLLGIENWKILIRKLNTMTVDKLVTDAKNLRLEIIDDVDVTGLEVSAGNASGHFSVKMKTTERLYELVKSEDALHKLGAEYSYDKETADAREKNKALPVLDRIPEVGLDWPKFYDLLVPNGEEITWTGRLELIKDGKDWHVTGFSSDSFSYRGKEFSRDQFTRESELWPVDCKINDPNAGVKVQEIIENRQKFIVAPWLPTPQDPIDPDPDPPIPVGSPPGDQPARKRYATEVFSQVSLDFNEHYIISEALQYYESSRRRDIALELRGTEFKALAEASRKKDYLAMITLLEGSGYKDYPYWPEASITDSAYQKLLSGDRVQMFLKGNFVGLPLDQIYMLSFRNFDTVLRSANFNDVQDPTNLQGRDRKELFINNLPKLALSENEDFCMMPRWIKRN